MSSNIKEFVRTVRTFDKKEVPELAAKFQRALTLEGLRRVTERSPVDQGLFKGNWQLITEDISSVAPREDLDKVGAATISREAGKARSIKPFSFSGLANGLFYANLLEDGSSMQAPGGIVAPVIAELAIIADQFGARAR